MNNKNTSIVALAATLALAVSTQAAIIDVLPLPGAYTYQAGDVFHWTTGTGATGNYYLPVIGAETYDSALALAAGTARPSGVPSNYTAHLLTVTSTEEAQMIDAIFPAGAGSTWIAVDFTDENNAANATYTAGPEAGLLVSSFSYSPDWRTGDPDIGQTRAYLDCNTGEWAGVLAGDLATFTEGYVVEFSIIPEPSAYAAIFAAGALVLAVARRRRA